MKAKRRLKKTKYYGVSFNYRDNCLVERTNSMGTKVSGRDGRPNMVLIENAIKEVHPEYTFIRINSVFEISPRAYR